MNNTNRLPSNTLLNNEENSESKNSSFNSNSSEMSVNEVGLEYLKYLYNKKCHDGIKDENKLEDILSKIFEIKRGSERDFSLKFNECSLSIFLLQFLKDHFHDVNYIKDEWYGNSFKDFILNMFDDNKNLRDKMLKFLYLSTNINLEVINILIYNLKKVIYLIIKYYINKVREFYIQQ